MDKIAVNGFFNEELIKKKYKSQNAEVDFNVSLAENKQKYDYDAVFFTGSFDEKAAYSWLGNEHLRIAPSQADLFAELDFFFGIPNRLEIERKFLVDMPDEKMLLSLPNCGFVEISQAYIKNGKENFRLRKRGLGNDYIYYKTIKKNISKIKRTETEYRITKREYENGIKGNKIISKIRYLILYKNKYFELDIFPFWQDKAVLEIELKQESEKFEIPNFLNVIEEVTFNAHFRNSYLAEKYGMYSV